MDYSGQPLQIPLHVSILPGNVLYFCRVNSDCLLYFWLFIIPCLYVYNVLGTGPLTVFAPNNQGFDKLPTGKLSDLLSNTTALQGELTN